MARIRTVKPEAPQHRKVGRLSIHARWLWLVMITQSDDEGRLVADPGQLRILAFPYDRDVTDDDVTARLKEIAATGLLRLYEVERVPYAEFPSWRDHQRINRPTPSRLPTYRDSVSPHGALSEPSARTHGGSEGIGRERKGSDRKGEESEGRDAGDGSPAPSPSLVAPPSSDHSDPEDTSALRAKSTGHPTYRRPSRGEYGRTLAEVASRHPELSTAEQEDRAMRVFAEELKP